MYEYMKHCLAVSDKLCEALSDYCELKVFSKKEFFIYTVVEKRAIECEENDYWIRSLSPVDRIRRSLETREVQSLIKRVPQYLIASYLQMTAEHYAKLQRILNKG